MIGSCKSLFAVVLGATLLGGCASSGSGEDPVNEPGQVAEESSTGGDVTSAPSGNPDSPPTVDDFDTRYVDQLSLPQVSAPVVSGAEIQTTAPIGRNTEERLSPPPGADVQSNLGFFPSLTISASRQSNPARVNGGDDDSDTVISVLPVLKYRGAIKNRHIYELSASASGDSFSDSENLDTENYQLGAALRLDMTEKLKTDVYAGRAASSDPRGQTATRILDEGVENDEYEEDSIGGRVTIGRRSNPIQVVLGADQSTLDFTNNQQDQRDREDDRVSAGLYVNLSPRTSVFVTADKKDFDYEGASSLQFDSVATSVGIGLGWEPTYTTSLLLRAGNVEKKYNTSTFDDEELDTYLAKLTWLPTEFDAINVYGSRNFEESTDLRSPVIVSDLVGISLDHAFTDAFRGQVFFNLIDDELVGVREDEIVDYGIGLYYDVARWLSLGAAWNRTERESSDPSANYDSDSFTVSATVKPRFNNDFGDPAIQTTEDLRSSE